MHALTEALNGIRLCTTLHCPVEWSGTWGISVPQQKGAAPFSIVMQGRAWLEIEGLPPTQICAGDFTIVPRGAAYTVKNALDSSTVPLQTLMETVPTNADGVMRCGTGGETLRAIGGTFFFEEAQASPLLRVLPPLLHIRAKQGQRPEWLGSMTRFLDGELSDRQPGTETVITRLSEILFVKAIRAYVAELPEEEGGWLHALSDPEIGAALALIHAQPQQPWRVETLAATVAMSRSAFAARFAALTGDTPLRYVTRWRIHRAARLLRTCDWNVAQIALEAGYQSEAAFSRVFKQWTGESPAAYRRARH